MFVRVRDKETRHEFDLVEGHSWLVRGLVERVKPEFYPPSRLPRPAKPYKNLAGHPATQEASVPVWGADEADNTEE